jgi:hypothetical protein
MRNIFITDEMWKHFYNSWNVDIFLYDRKDYGRIFVAFLNGNILEKRVDWGVQIGVCRDVMWNCFVNGWTMDLFF